jgi:hypothetical protein
VLQHTSIAQPSLCTTRRIRSYFDDGSLPSPGTICAVDEPFFPEDGGTSAWANVLMKLSMSDDQGTTLSA